MDDDWIYAARPARIFHAIARGRPNGMPAYGDKLTVEQMWHIPLYVESLSQADDRRQAGAPDAEERDEP